jgi:hypothetical protein
VARGDSAFYAGVFVEPGRRNRRRNRAHFSVTERIDPTVRRTIAGSNEDCGVAVKYPNAIFNAQIGEWVSDAQIAVVVPHTAPATGRDTASSPRLIVRRSVRRASTLRRRRWYDSRRSLPGRLMRSPRSVDVGVSAGTERGDHISS